MRAPSIACREGRSGYSPTSRTAEIPKEFTRGTARQGDEGVRIEIDFVAALWASGHRDPKHMDEFGLTAVCGAGPSIQLPTHGHQRLEQFISCIRELSWVAPIESHGQPKRSPRVKILGIRGETAARRLDGNCSTATERITDPQPLARSGAGAIQECANECVRPSGPPTVDRNRRCVAFPVSLLGTHPAINLRPGNRLEPGTRSRRVAARPCSHESPRPRAEACNPLPLNDRPDYSCPGAAATGT